MKNEWKCNMTGFRALLVVLGAGLLAAGCATKPDPADAAAVHAYEDANDPVEPLNRYFFELNRFADIIVIRPAAEIYDGIFPRFVKDRVRNFLDNLRSPVILANDALQGEWERAGTTASRFGINSTVGVAGLFDPATDMDYQQHGEDFGQTLAVYGTPEGPYFYLPVLGPAPPRDLTGFVVDQAFDPMTYFFWNEPKTIPVIRFVVNGIDLRARSLSTLDEIERTSVDYYAAIRSLYRQSRKDEIANGVTNVDDLPDIPDADFDTDESSLDPATN